MNCWFYLVFVRAMVCTISLPIRQKRNDKADEGSEAKAKRAVLSTTGELGTAHGRFAPSIFLTLSTFFSRLLLCLMSHHLLSALASAHCFICESTWRNRLWSLFTRRPVTFLVVCSGPNFGECTLSELTRSVFLRSLQLWRHRDWRTLRFRKLPFHKNVCRDLVGTTRSNKVSSELARWV